MRRQGCDIGNEGYKDCTGIYPMMPMVEDIQKIVLEGGNAIAITEVARHIGIPDLSPFVFMWFGAKDTPATKAAIARLAKADWFRERVFDVYLWELGGER